MVPKFHYFLFELLLLHVVGKSSLSTADELLICGQLEISFACMYTYILYTGVQERCTRDLGVRVTALNYNCVSPGTYKYTSRLIRTI